jgi:hypothetical protein
MTDLPKRHWKRRANGQGIDPWLSLNAPAELIEMVAAKAAERKVSRAAIVREALRQYVGEGRAA